MIKTIIVYIICLYIENKSALNYKNTFLLLNYRTGKLRV